MVWVAAFPTHGRTEHLPRLILYNPATASVISASAEVTGGDSHKGWEVGGVSAPKDARILVVEDDQRDCASLEGALPGAATGPTMFLPAADTVRRRLTRFELSSSPSPRVLGVTFHLSRSRLDGRS